MKKVLFLFMVTLSLTFLTSCGKNIEYDVYVTVYPMQFLVERIAGDTVEVGRVPGSTVHSNSIDWSAKEIIDMYESDLLFYVNAGLDTYIEQEKDDTFKDGNVSLIDISQYVDYNEVCFTHEHDDEGEEEEENHTCDESQKSDDPHFWLDPVRMLQAAVYVKDNLILIYPENTDLYEANFLILQSQLEKLDDDFQAMAYQATKPLITTTMLFTYFHDRYELEIHPISTSAHSSEQTADNLIGFVDFATANSLDYIIFEKNANSPDGDSVLASYQEVDPNASRLYMHGLGNLTEEEIDDGLTYLTIMYDNLDVLKKSTK